MKSLLKVASLGALLLTSCCCLLTVIAILAAPTIWQKIASVITDGVSAVWEDDRSCLTESSHPNPQITLLKSYVPANVLKTINPQFYTYFGYRDWWRYPLVYPYSLHAVDSMHEGDLVNDGNVKNYDEGGTGFGSNISGITRLSLDKNYLLLQIKSLSFATQEAHQHTKTKYAIFTFKTREVSEFASEQAMRDQAKKLHFTGSFKLLSLREYDALFTCQK